MADNVNHPAHYQPVFQLRNLECIDFTRHLPFRLGNAFECIWMAGSEGDSDKAVNDLNKARWYISDILGKVDSCADDQTKFDPHLLLSLFAQIDSDRPMTDLDYLRYTALKALLYGDYQKVIDATASMMMKVLRDADR